MDVQRLFSVSFDLVASAKQYSLAFDVNFKTTVYGMLFCSRTVTYPVPFLKAWSVLLHLLGIIGEVSEIMICFSWFINGCVLTIFWLNCYVYGDDISSIFEYHVVNVSFKNTVLQTILPREVLKQVEFMSICLYLIPLAVILQRLSTTYYCFFQEWFFFFYSLDY